MAAESRKIRLKSLNPHVTCYLCKGYLIDATTVTECLHTFCKSCLLKHLEDNNTCPKCEILIHQSHPKNYISYDRTMQEIVYKVVPDLFKKEIVRREEFCRKRNIPFDNPLNNNEDQKPLPDAQPENNGDCHRNDEQVSLKLIAETEGHLQNLERIFVRVSGQATVTHLKKFLSKKLGCASENFKEIDILCNDELMGKDHTLKFIFRTRWRNKEFPLELHYRRHVDF